MSVNIPNTIHPHPVIENTAPLTFSPILSPVSLKVACKEMGIQASEDSCQKTARIVGNKAEILYAISDQNSQIIGLMQTNPTKASAQIKWKNGYQELTRNKEVSIIHWTQTALQSIHQEGMISRERRAQFKSPCQPSQGRFEHGNTTYFIRPIYLPSVLTELFQNQMVKMKPQTKQLIENSLSTPFTGVYLVADEKWASVAILRYSTKADEHEIGLHFLKAKDPGVEKRINDWAKMHLTTPNERWRGLNLEASQVAL